MLVVHVTNKMYQLLAIITILKTTNATSNEATKLRNPLVVYNIVVIIDNWFISFQLTIFHHFIVHEFRHC